MTPEEYTAKMEELRTLITEKLAELEENPKWGTADERDAIATLLDDIAVQADALSMSLSESAEGEE